MTRLGRAIGKSVERRQHMKLDIRLAGPCGVDKAAGLNDRGCQQPRPGEHVLQHMRDGAQALVLARYRDWPLGLALYGRFEMILIVLTHASEISDDIDSVLT